jgi:hypothetical protein
MSLFDRWNRPVGIRVGTIALAATMVLALSAVSASHTGLAAVERSHTAQTSTGADVKATNRSAKEVRGATPYIELKNEPAPKLIVDPPLPDLLDQGVVWIQWRAENVHILPVFGKSALSASPRIGHLHIHVDDLPWWWADPSNVNTIDLAGMPPGPHKILIELVDANHEVFPGQSQTVTFTVAKGAPRHGH